ncbi:hypothetical protein DFH09DRAFT_915053 [Mycena vulgaris]|nr:hypothetical protein DFH09DRAFT_915053 [Mycena vulgaris]
MTIEELVDIPEEKGTVNDATDQEISDAVKERRAEEQLLKIEGGNDHGFANNMPKPSRQEALEAVSTLWGYISDHNDGFARQLEGILASFRRQVCLDDTKAMHDMQMTDYFTRIAATNG